jgi:hypothetical protein
VKMLKSFFTCLNPSGLLLNMVSFFPTPSVHACIQLVMYTVSGSSTLLVARNHAS